MPNPAISSSRRLSSSARVATLVLRCSASSAARRGIPGCCFTVATSKMSPRVQIGNGYGHGASSPSRLHRENAAPAINSSSLKDQEFSTFRDQHPRFGQQPEKAYAPSGGCGCAGSPRLPPKISKTTPCKVSGGRCNRRFGPTLDTSGKSAAQFHHRKIR